MKYGSVFSLGWVGGLCARMCVGDADSRDESTDTYCMALFVPIFILASHSGRVETPRLQAKIGRAPEKSGGSTCGFGLKRYGLGIIIE